MANLRKQVNMYKRIRPSDDTTQARPDWVILGAPHTDGQVLLLASKKLNRAELVAQLEKPEISDFCGVLLDDPIRIGRPTYFLRVEMPEFVMILADTYEQALRTLFEQWSPEPDRDDHAVPVQGEAPRRMLGP